jgi:hypothetical protein
MTITLTIPDSALPAWELRLAEYNAGSGEAPVTLEQYWQILVTEATDNYVAAKLAADLEAMAGDTDLVAAGLKAMTVSSERRATALAAFEAALLMPSPASQG